MFRVFYQPVLKPLCRATSIRQVTKRAIMASKESIDTELSPLDQIRQLEAGAVRQIAAAREASEHRIKETKRQVKVTLEQARESGHQRGLNRYKQIVTSAEEEALVIVSQAHNRVKLLRQKGKQQMSSAVQQAVNLIISLEGDGEGQ
jgi:flagellar biosynthesis/type III secretory pathway protein FliH